VRRDDEFFGDQELSLLYIAKKLRDALRLEEVLTSAGIDYLVETDTYRGGFLFVSERVGAFFYVLPAAIEQTRQVIAENGFKPHVKPTG
jgi:hypothetical protein